MQGRTDPSAETSGPRPGTTSIPPPSEDEREVLRRAADLLAWVLDGAVAVPGTRYRIGLDPLLGLIPGLGDAVVSLIGSAIMLLAARLQLPRIVLLRMAVNMFLNGTVGAIPVVGDLFSVWFRSNSRNAELVRTHAGPGRVTTAGDWVFVGGLATGTLLLIIGMIAALVWAGTALWHAVAGLWCGSNGYSRC